MHEEMREQTSTKLEKLSLSAIKDGDIVYDLDLTSGPIVKTLYHATSHEATGCKRRHITAEVMMTGRNSYLVDRSMGKESCFLS